VCCYVIVAADDLRDAHVQIVHYHAEIVGRRAVGGAMIRSSSSLFSTDLALDHVSRPPRHERILERTTGLIPSGGAGRLCPVRSQ